MDVANKDRFPHYYMLKQLGEDTEEARWYNQRYNQELNKEYEFVWENYMERFKLGGDDGIHKIVTNEKNN